MTDPLKKPVDAVNHIGARLVLGVMVLLAVGIIAGLGWIITVVAWAG